MKTLNSWAICLLLGASLFAACGDDDPVLNEEGEKTPAPDPEPAPYIKKTQAGWPAQYDGVMLQGFYWNSYTDSQWTYLEKQTDDLTSYFSLIWVPQSGYCGSSNNMGYMPLYYFDQHSSFGSEDNLRSLIRTLKSKGTGLIADVVINHRNNLGVGGSWTDFAVETYKGVSYRMLPSDIVKNDDNGGTASWAASNGQTLSANEDTGEGWDGCRDLDHKSQNVQRTIFAYLDFLKNDLGYTGFRYDMVKGYAPLFTGVYNDSIQPKFSVGEYWDGDAQRVNSWIDGTKVNDSVQSAAFDFAFRYTCRDAVGGNWSKLLGSTSISSATYRRFAVTFCENHDTELRSSTEQQDPIRKDTLACNAWLLANPGTPCVFYKHWQAYKRDIKLMIEARKLVGITNISSYQNLSKDAEKTYAARKVKGKNGEIIVAAGPGCASYQTPEGFTELLSGYHYRYLVSSTCNTSSWEATVARINEEEKAEPFEPHQATVYVSADFTPVYFYIWDSNNNSQLNGSWPGKLMTNTVHKGDRDWYTQSIDIPSANYYFNIIFNQGNGKPQTSDIGHITSDRYYIATMSGSSISYRDVTSEYKEK